jgi:5'-3' exonuclease
MKHRNEENEKSRRAYQKQNRGQNKLPPGGIANVAQQPQSQGQHIRFDQPQQMGRAARILAEKEAADVKLQKGHAAKEELRKKLKSKSTSAEENAKAAGALKLRLLSNGILDDAVEVDKDYMTVTSKRKAENISTAADDDDALIVDVDDDDEEDSEEDEAAIDEARKKLKEKIKEIEQAKLDDFSKNVQDNVRLHEPGWKDRYYTDKCKADDVKNHGGREHLFKSYVVGLCWVMKYYYEGCPSWKWYYPFHYAPFASDLRNIERFQKDCESFELCEPFKPV